MTFKFVRFLAWISVLTSVAASADLDQRFLQEQRAPDRDAGPQSGNISLQPEMLTFHYASFEGELQLDCTHKLQDAAAQDWAVQCADSRGNRRSYIVHLWVTAYTHPSAPKQSYEVLYWITDTNSPSGTGTTVWFHFKDPAELQELEVGQSVDSNTAELELSIHLK